MILVLHLLHGFLQIFDMGVPIISVADDHHDPASRSGRGGLSRRAGAWASPLGDYRYRGWAVSMYSADGVTVVVFNGEIYNFQALKAELAALGHGFRTASDTEAILYAWRAWGPGFVERLEGMFAFALWDAVEETLILARDRLGKKLFCYAPLAIGLELADFKPRNYELWALFVLNFYSFLDFLGTHLIFSRVS